MQSGIGLTMVLVCGGVTGLAAPRAVAQPDVADELLPARIVGYIYINARTGERIETLAPASRRGEVFWQNSDIAGSCSYFYGQDRPTRDESLGRVKFGSTVVDWGDVAGPAVVDGFDFAMVGNIEPEEPGSIVEGFGIRVGFLERYDSRVNPGGPVTEPGGAGPAFETAAITLMDFYRGTGSCSDFWCSWAYTVDLEGSGLEFTIGDTASGLGGDLDGDGLADFGYSFSFIQNQREPKGIVGCFLVRPASLGGGGTATGVVDSFSWFNSLTGPYQDYYADLDFGGGACPATPYASFYMNLYGPVAPSPCDAIDYNGDGLIDFGDYLEFLNRFERQDASADLTEDGVIDFGDWLEFYNRYDSCVG
ncbi:MAG: EF-hand domain-containing protein [Phycisphaerales bacterium]|nr:EF-hand domain-containing protein [Phycisphaerales bacterium]